MLSLASIMSTMSGDKTAYAALLPKQEYHDDSNSSTDCDEQDVPVVPQKTPWWKKAVALHFLFLILHFCVITVFTMLLIKKFTFHVCKPQANTAGAVTPGGPPEFLIDSPVNKAISWGLSFYKSEFDSDFVGKPNPDIDAAWEQLLRHTNVRISEEDLRLLGREHEANIKLPDGGYAGLINGFHELHCLKRLYQYNWPEYYFPDFTPDQHELNRQHNMHCIDQLRQGIMCHGDTQISTYRWDYYTRVPLVNDTAPHQCVNFQKYYNWARDHSIEHMFDAGYLIHPTLGPAYPDGKGSKVGVVTPPTQAELEEHHKHDMFGHNNPVAASAMDNSGH